MSKNEYFSLTRSSDELLLKLLRIFNGISVDNQGDFLGKFALMKGQGRREFFTPTPSVRYIWIEVIESYSGEIYWILAT